MSNFIVQALKGEDITIYGDGFQTRSFCYMDDMVRFMNTEPEVTGPMNLGNPNEFIILELAEKVIELTLNKYERENFDLSIKAVKALIAKAKEIDPKLSN